MLRRIGGGNFVSYSFITDDMGHLRWISEGVELITNFHLIHQTNYNVQLCTMHFNVPIKGVSV